MHVLYSVSLTAQIHAPGTAARGRKRRCSRCVSRRRRRDCVRSSDAPNWKKKWNWKRSLEDLGSKNWVNLGWVGTFILLAVHDIHQPTESGHIYRGDFFVCAMLVAIFDNGFLVFEHVATCSYFPGTAHSCLKSSGVLQPSEGKGRVYRCRLRGKFDVAGWHLFCDDPVLPGEWWGSRHEILQLAGHQRHSVNFLCCVDL